MAAERAELLKEKANLAKERKRFEADSRKLAEKEARLETIISERAAAIVAPERTLIAQERAQIAQKIEVRRSKIETENQEFIDGPVKDLYKKYTPTIPWQVIRASLMVHPEKISALKAMIKRGGNPRFTSADHNQFEIIGGPFQVRTTDETSDTLRTFSSSRWIVEEAIAAAQHMGEISLVTWDHDRTSNLRAQIKAANLHGMNLIEDITYENAQKRISSMSSPKPFTYIDTGDRRYLFASHNQGNSPYGWIGAINVPCHFGFENEEDQVTEKLSKIMEGLKKRGVRAEKQQEKTQEVNWQAVEIALKKAPLLLTSAYNMENLGLNPQVFAINPNNFSIAGAVITREPSKNTKKNNWDNMIENGIPPMTRDRYNEEYGPIRISQFDNGWLNDLYPKAFNSYCGLITGEILIPGHIRKK